VILWGPPEPVQGAESVSGGQRVNVTVDTGGAAAGLKAALAAAVRHDRLIVIGGLVAIALLAWAYTIYLAQGMEQIDLAALAQPRAMSWGALEFVSLFFMWVVMMVAMMVPSAAPVALTFSRMLPGHGAPVVSHTALFIAGYFVVWSVFSALATVAQWGLHATALLSPSMETTSDLFAGMVLIAAGLFQFTPLKHVCLDHCRSPLGFFLTEWRGGAAGAFVMGWRHGTYCVGCCAVLMALLFVTGVMNLLWIAALSLFVLIEKVFPAGNRIAKFSGVLLIAAGVWMLWRAIA
jgi:predicted metal-binding membrane protein